MTTATLVSITTPTSAARHEIYFDGMERSRTLFVDDENLHLQMTLVCDCNRCRNREERMLGALERQNISYTVEVFSDGSANERFVCFARNGQDPIEQVKSQIGMDVRHVTQYPSISQERKSERDKKVLIGTSLTIAAVLAITFVVWLYRFINPPKEVISMMVAWVAVHGVIMLLRCITSEAKIARVMHWLGGVGLLALIGTIVGLTVKLGDPVTKWFDQLMAHLPMFFQMVGMFVGGVAVLFGFVCIFGFLLGHVACLMSSFMSDGELDSF